MAESKMHRLLPALIAIGGLAIGGGAGAAVMFVGGQQSVQAEKNPDAATTFVPTGKILAPLVSAEGHLTGYVRADVQISVDHDRAEWVQARMPLLLHAINMRTFRTPLASGPDGLLPNVDGLRKVVVDAAGEAFGAGVVKQVAITQASPA